MLVSMSEQTNRITEADVRHVAKLSRLHLTDPQVHAFTEQLAGVLGYVAKLEELDLRGVEPMAHALTLTNVMREDAEQPGLPVDAVLANAPEKDQPYFKVPKVLDDGSGA